MTREQSLELIFLLDVLLPVYSQFTFTLNINAFYIFLQMYPFPFCIYLELVKTRRHSNSTNILCDLEDRR